MTPVEQEARKQIFLELFFTAPRRTKETDL